MARRPRPKRFEPCAICLGTMKYIETDELGDYYECQNCDWDTHLKNK